MNKSLDSIVIRYVGFGLLLLFLMVMLYLVRGALPVFVIGGVVAFAMEPVLQRMEKRGHTRSRAVGFIFVIVLLIGCIFLSLFAAAFQQGQSLVRDAPAQFRLVKKFVNEKQDKLNKSKLPEGLKESINASIDPYLAYLGGNITKKANELAAQETPMPTPQGTPSATPQGAPTSIPKPILAPVPQPTGATTTSKSSEMAGPKVGELVPVAGTVLSAVGAFVAHLFLTLIISFGLMLEAQHIKARLLMLVPPLYRRDVTELSTSINEILGAYVRGQLIVCGTFGVLCTIAFETISHFYGMQYPLILGAFAGVVYVLPYVGLAITLVVATATAYFTSTHQMPAAIAAMSSVVVFNLMMDYIISPRVLGRGVGLHPLMVIFALLCGFELGGPLGTVAAVPVFAALRVIAIYLFPQLAAPLPDESPQATSLDKPHGPVSESSKRIAEAEEAVKA